MEKGVSVGSRKPCYGEWSICWLQVSSLWRREYLLAPVIHFLGKVFSTKDPELGLHQEDLPQSYIMISDLSLPL